MGKKRSTKPTGRHREADKDAFVALLRNRGTVTAAVKLIGVHRATVYEWREKDSVFAADWDEAAHEIDDIIEQTAFEYAVNGYTESRTIDDGTTVKIETMHKRDPSMIRWLMQTRQRSVYGQHSAIELSGELTTKRIVFGTGPDPAAAEPAEPLEEA